MKYRQSGIAVTPVGAASAEAVPSLYVQPGQMRLSTGGEITTILGSCVAVCLWSHRGIGGMNHFLLPRDAPTPQTELRYAPTAISRLVQAMIEAGAARSTLVAKVFGGASVMASFQLPNHLGLQNAEAALRLLAAEGIAIVAQDIGGTRGRKLKFQTDDGSAIVKYL